jgi:oligopeptide transport system substrate-binding protein
LFEGLVGDHPQSDTEMPSAAAVSWEHNADYTEWVFQLRQGAKWSDGELVTAHDFVFAYNRMLHPELAAPYVEMLYFIKNAEAYNKGEIIDFAKVGVKAEGDYTLRIQLKEPVPYLPGVTRHYTWFPVPKHIVLQHGEISDRFTEWTDVGNIVGNGAFVLQSWKMNDHVAVKKNPHYWDVEHVKLNGVRFFPTENTYTETRAFLAGQLHMTYQLPPDLVPKMEKEYPQFLRKDPYVGSRFVRVNVTRPALNDPRVRMALSLSLDRKSLCDTVLQGFAPADTLSPDLGAYQPESVVAYDLEKARALLAEAGYPNGKGFPRYSILIGSGGTRSTSEAIQAMWKKNLNILFDIHAMDYGSYISAQQKLDFDVTLAGWIGDYLDPTTFLLMWTEGNGNNNTGWHSDDFEKLLDDAAHSADPAERLKLFVQAEKLLMEEQPIIPFAWQAKTYLLQPQVKNWQPLLLDNHPWSAVELNSEKGAP